MFPHANKRILRTVVLRHQRKQDTHYDWLIAGLVEDASRCLTFRISDPPRHWPRLGWITATQLPDHRKHYLSYQGWVSSAPDDPAGQMRGKVVRVDAGYVSVQLQTRFRLILLTRWRSETFRVDLRRIRAHHWRFHCDDAQKRDFLL